MRHRVAGRELSRTSEHRLALSAILWHRSLSMKLFRRLK